MGHGKSLARQSNNGHSVHRLVPLRFTSIHRTVCGSRVSSSRCTKDWTARCVKNNRTSVRFWFRAKASRRSRPSLSSSRLSNLAGRGATCVLRGRSGPDARLGYVGRTPVEVSDLLPRTPKPANPATHSRKTIDAKIDRAMRLQYRIFCKQRKRVRSSAGYNRGPNRQTGQ
jgi:hypothetical protein